MTDLPTKAINQVPAKILEGLLAYGDLSPLTAEQRVQYYTKLCDYLKLNPLTKPFEYIKLNGKLQLYALKSCAEQLRKVYNISLEITARKIYQNCCVVTAKASQDGRVDESIGAVSIAGLKGDALCNALMKAETKAKRRVTLSICGLGMLDESELETIRDVKKVTEHEMGRHAQTESTTADPLINEQKRRKALAELTSLVKESQEWDFNKLKRLSKELCLAESSKDLTLTQIYSIIDYVKANTYDDFLFEQNQQIEELLSKKKSENPELEELFTKAAAEIKSYGDFARHIEKVEVENDSKNS